MQTVNTRLSHCQHRRHCHCQWTRDSVNVTVSAWDTVTVSEHKTVTVTVGTGGAGVCSSSNQHRSALLQLYCICDADMVLGWPTSSKWHWRCWQLTAAYTQLIHAVFCDQRQPCCNSPLCTCVSCWDITVSTTDVMSITGCMVELAELIDTRAVLGDVSQCQWLIPAVQHTPSSNSANQPLTQLQHGCKHWCSHSYMY